MQGGSVTNSAGLRNFGHMKYLVPYLLSFRQMSDQTGTLVTTQDAQGLPFNVKRVFWVYGTPAGAERGGHAHRTTQEVLTVIKGSVRVETMDASGRQTFELTNPTQGLYIPPYCWIRVLPSLDALICCMTSTFFEEADYIRDYQEFEKIISNIKSETPAALGSTK